MNRYKKVTGEALLHIYNKLYTSFGARGWWPAETPFEVVIGAILTQNTAWKNVEKAVNNLKEKNLLSAENLYDIDIDTLKRAVKPSGYYNQKAQKIKNFLEFFKEYDFSFKKLKNEESQKIREQLLSVKGIGEETADCILLYALDKPIFVIDAYTKRVFHRLGFVDEKTDYSSLQKLFAAHLEKDTRLFNEYHALIDYLAHHICKKIPLCNTCIMQGDCNYYKYEISKTG